jgi:hypothetical protein
MNAVRLQALHTISKLYRLQYLKNLITIRNTDSKMAKKYVHVFLHIYVHVQYFQFVHIIEITGFFAILKPLHNYKFCLCNFL